MTTLIYAILPEGCANMTVPNDQVKTTLSKVPATIKHGVGHCSTYGYTVF